MTAENATLDSSIPPCPVPTIPTLSPTCCTTIVQDHKVGHGRVVLAQRWAKPCTDASTADAADPADPAWELLLVAEISHHQFSDCTELQVNGGWIGWSPAVDGKEVTSAMHQQELSLGIANASPGAREELPEVPNNKEMWFASDLTSMCFCCTTRMNLPYCRPQGL